MRRESHIQDVYLCDLRYPDLLYLLNDSQSALESYFQPSQLFLIFLKPFLSSFYLCDLCYPDLLYLLNDRQSGFRKLFSTITAVHDISETILE